MQLFYSQLNSCSCTCNYMPHLSFLVPLPQFSKIHPPSTSPSTFHYSKYSLDLTSFFLLITTAQVHREYDEHIPIDGRPAERLQFCPVLPGGQRSLGSLSRGDWRRRGLAGQRVHTTLSRGLVGRRWPGNHRYSTLSLDDTLRWVSLVNGQRRLIGWSITIIISHNGW